MFKKVNQKTLDNLSWGILSELRSNARITTTELGKRVGLSSPAVAERVQKLERLGFIKGYKAIIDFDKIGLTIQAFISFKATAIKHPEMIKMVSAIPEIVEWYAITGNACLIMRVAVDSSLKLEKILTMLGEYGETSTSIILSGNDDLGPLPVNGSERTRRK